MKKVIKVFALLLLVTLVFTIIGCDNNSVRGKYYREFNDYISTTMYIELKSNMSFETDGTVPGIPSKGTYKIDGSVITFTFNNVFSGAEETATATISNNKITIEGVVYVK